MNLSGAPVKSVLEYYKIPPDTNMLVVYDDMRFHTGAVRLKLQTSRHPHNGVGSVISTLGLTQLQLLCMGIGMPSVAGLAPVYVQSKFPASDLPLIASAIDFAVWSIDQWIELDLKAAQQRINLAKGDTQTTHLESKGAATSSTEKQ